MSKKQLATAGQLKTAEEFIDDDFVCMYGDSIFNFSLKKMIKQHSTKKSFITMSLNEYKTNLPYGVIQTSKNGKVLSWDEKPEIKANVNMGCYVMNSKVFNLIPKYSLIVLRLMGIGKYLPRIKANTLCLYFIHSVNCDK